MWGIIPVARNGTRIQPLAFSKELLHVGSRRDGQREQPRVGSEYLVERMIRGGVGKICFVISPGKGDVLRYYGDSFASARIAYVVQTQAAELCDAVLMDEACRVREIQVKRADAASKWVWGAFKMPGAILHELNRLWIARNRLDEYIGTLVNAWLAAGGQTLGVRAGESHVDVGTLPGFRRAVAMLSGSDDGEISEWSGERADIR